MPSGIGVKEVFAELFSKSDRIPYLASIVDSSHIAGAS